MSRLETVQSIISGGDADFRSFDRANLEEQRKKSRLETVQGILGVQSVGPTRELAALGTQKKQVAPQQPSEKKRFFKSLVDKFTGKPSRFEIHVDANHPAIQRQIASQTRQNELFGEPDTPVEPKLRLLGGPEAIIAREKKLGRLSVADEKSLEEIGKENIEYFVGSILPGGSAGKGFAKELSRVEKLAAIEVGKKKSPTVLAKVSKTVKSYPTIHQGGVIKMVEGEPVKIVDGVETFIHKGNGGWIVSEASTGRFIAESRSSEGAIAKANFVIDDVGKFKKLISENQLPTNKLSNGFRSVLDVPLAKDAQKMTLSKFKKENGFYFEGDTSKNYYKGTADEFWNEVRSPKTPVAPKSATGETKVSQAIIKPSAKSTYVRSSEIISLKNEPASILEADRRISLAKSGGMESRPPLTGVKLSYGRTLLIDGNATFGALKKKGQSLPVEHIDLSGLDRVMTDAEITDAVRTHQLGKNNEKYFSTLIDDVIKETGTVRPSKGGVNVKPVKSILEKKYIRGEAVRDLNRDTLIIKDPGEVKSIVDSLQKKGAVPLKSERPGLKNRFLDPTPGYKDANFQFKLPDGSIYELQMMQENMYAAKQDFGHLVYDLTEKTKNAQMSVAEKQAVERVRQKSNSVYERAFSQDNPLRDRPRPIVTKSSMNDRSIGTSLLSKSEITSLRADLNTLRVAKSAKVSSSAEKVLGALDSFDSSIKSSVSPDALSIAGGAKTVKSSIERGFISSAKDVIPEAQKIAGQYVPRSTDDLAIRAKNLIKDNITAAENLAMNDSSDAAVATASELLKHYKEESEKATSHAVKNALYDQAAKVANTIAPKLTEAGRSVQAASILGRLTPEGQVRFAAGQIQKFNEGARLQNKIPELTGEQTQKIIKEMTDINGMVDGIEKSMKFQKLQNYVSDLVPTPTFKKIVAVWKAGLLTGLKTTGVNIMSNVSHFGTEVAKDIPAAMVDKVASLFSGKRAVSFNLKGVSTGAKEGVKKGIQYFKTGFDERNIGTKLDYTRINFGKGKLANGLQAYTDTVFKLLGSEDQPFYYASKLRSLYDQAKVGAINKGLKRTEAQKFINEVMQNPTESMVKYAALDAETAVFQNQTVLGNAAKSIQKIGGGAGEIIVPFSRTPAAVAMQILNYTPIGIVKTIFENAGKGNFDQRLFSQGLGRGLTGTAIMALGSALMAAGLVTLARPKNEKEQKLWELEGRQANSIKIGGKWRQVQVLGPAGNVLLLGGYFNNELLKSGSPTEAIANTLAGTMQSFSQQTFLTGVSNFIDAISDPSRSASNVLGSTLASTVPTFVSDVAKSTDSKERRTESIVERFMVRIPGLRESLEPRVDVLGGEVTVSGNPLELMADPSRPSTIKSTPVIEEIRRLWDEGFKVSPTLLGDKKGYTSLTQAQNTKLWKRAGEITNGKLSALIKHGEYQKLGDDEKSKIVDSVVEKSKVSARAEAVLELTSGISGDAQAAKLSELKKSGLLTRDVFDLYNKIR